MFALPPKADITHTSRCTNTQQFSPVGSQAKEQSSCSEWTGVLPQTEHCCGDWKTLMGAFGSNPAGPFARVGLRWCGGWRRAHL